MTSNYDSGRAALALALGVVGPGGCPAVEAVLPADSHYPTCSPMTLCCAMRQCGILADLLIVDYPDRAAVLSETITGGYLALCLYGLHSAPADQRWYTLLDMDDCGGYTWATLDHDHPMGCLNNAHFCSPIIVVRGVRNAKQPRC